LNEWILCAINDDSAESEFSITPEELATLEVYLDNKNYVSTAKACVSAQKKPFLSLDEVF